MKTRRRSGPGALSVLAAAFIASAALRAGSVLAGLPEIRDDGFGHRVAVPSERPESAGTDPMPLISELQRQARALQQRKQRLDEREGVLKEVEKRLDARLEDLDKRRQALESEVKQARSAATDDVRQLAAMYQTMKPKLAGRIFNEMQPSFAAGFLAELRPDAAALILSNMDPTRAYAVSLLLAGRNVESTASAASGAR